METIFVATDAPKLGRPMAGVCKDGVCRVLIAAPEHREELMWAYKELFERGVGQSAEGLSRMGKAGSFALRP